MSKARLILTLVVSLHIEKAAVYGTDKSKNLTLCYHLLQNHLTWVFFLQLGSGLCVEDSLLLSVLEIEVQGMLQLILIMI